MRKRWVEWLLITVLVAVPAFPGSLRPANGEALLRRER